ncbi:MAG: hypothetical protein IPO83_03820 [Chitinophagaceae bacterium]|nr:hypothetical protein [Chitinophagaceae bacterium]
MTVNDPVGLYIHSLDTGAIEFPQGLSFEDCWKIVRGSGNMILRAEFSVPDNSGHTMEDIMVGGNSLKFGSQLAEYINMVIYGKGFNFQLPDPMPSDCVAHCCTVPAFPNLVQPVDINQSCTPTPASLILSRPLEIFQAADAETILLTNKSMLKHKFVKKRI